MNEEELQAATYASLRAHPISDEAAGLAKALAVLLDKHDLATGARKNARKSTAEKFEYAVGAFLTDLLQAYGDDEPAPSAWVYRSMHAKSFTKARVSYRTFARLVDGLAWLGFLEHVDGHKVSRAPEDTGAYAARFRATPKLLKFCSDQGVEPAKVFDHFEFDYDLPKVVLELRAKKEGDYWTKTKPVGKPMEYEKDGVTTAIEDDVRELNEFFKEHKLRGGKHHGYVRLFHNGNDPDFFWNKGGRLYSQHFTDSYQVMSGKKRLKMRIDGLPVAEVDIRASYLTIFLSLHGIQLPQGDPYAIPGLGPEHRDAVKKWMVATFGNRQPIVRWPERMTKKSPELKEHRVKAITEAVLARYPQLRGWGKPLNGRTLNWADLMWMESNVMLSTMLELKRQHQTPSLSVHDSLIVPASATQIAMKVLEEWFFKQREVKPLLKANYADLPEGQRDTEGGL